VDTQTLLTVAAVVGSLVGVALGAFLASRFQANHWFRDRRLDAFADAQTAIYNMLAAALDESETTGPERVAADTRFGSAVDEWQQVRGRLGVLAGRSVIAASDEFHNAAEAAWDAKEGDKAEWARLWEAAKTHRNRLRDEMRKELGTR
jgi:hypothetical protein